jgi:hypothetical protein
MIVYLTNQNKQYKQFAFKIPINRILSILAKLILSILQYLKYIFFKLLKHTYISPKEGNKLLYI